jgi:23S rRNA (guanosine2251-2'-O)-methyltransferase
MKNSVPVRMIPPVARAVNPTRALETYKEAGLFVVGFEGRGLSRVVANACDLVAHIPMTSATESLNAGIAASIALYEVATARQEN